MNELKKISFVDTLREKIIKLFGYKEGTKFIKETKPYLRKYSYLEKLNIANIEEKLKKALNINKEHSKLEKGITKQECNDLLEWVVQQDRKILTEESECFENNSLNGLCGLSQGIISSLLKKMGLSPRISNVNPTITGGGLGGHAFNSVSIPVQIEDNKVVEKNYLLDVTYRQFFERAKCSPSGKFVEDKKYGGKVAPFAGYFLVKLPGGEKFADEILKDGFCELTNENAKLYGDSFALENYLNAKYSINYKDKEYFPVPKKRELNTGIDGEQYIKWFIDKERQDIRGIDYNEGELENLYGEKMCTPLMTKELQNNEKKSNSIYGKVIRYKDKDEDRIN